MKPYAELLEFNQPNPIRKEGFTRIRDQFPGLNDQREHPRAAVDAANWEDFAYFPDPERIMEFSGRWDYGENNARRLGETVKTRVPDLDAKTSMEDGHLILPTREEEVPIVRKYLQMGHESMIEMGEATFFIECSRIVSLELARHRHQERQEMSQRFVKFDGSDYDTMFIRPPGVSDDQWREILNSYVADLGTYKKLRAEGMSPQDARYVLPGGFVTKMIVKMNVKAWRHVLKLRLDKPAQPEMQELMQQVYDQLVDVFPNAMHGVLDGGRAVR